MELHTFTGVSRTLHLGKHGDVEHLHWRCILTKVEVNVAGKFFVLGPDSSFANGQLHSGAFVSNRKRKRNQFLSKENNSETRITASVLKQDPLDMDGEKER